MRSGLATLAVLGALAGAPWNTMAAQADIRIGPMIGLNNSTFRGDDAEGADSRTSFLLGGFLSFRLNRQFALQPELLYTRKGAEVTIEDVRGTIALNYVEIPVLAQIRFPSPSWTPFLLVGPAFSFRASCNVKIENQNAEFSTDCNDADVGIKDTDFSLVGGLGMEVRNVSISLRYDHGLTQLPDEGSASAYNQTFSLVFGYAFRLGR